MTSDQNAREILSIAKNIKNPLTGKTLGEEQRLVSVAPMGQGFEITYRRDGIDPKSKRQIEDGLVFALKGLCQEEYLRVKTVSENSSSDVYQKSKSNDSAPTQQAKIQAGHGPAQAKKKRVMGAKKVLAVSSGKGGVGKSTVSVNLACALKNRGKSVGLIDADIYGPSVPMLLNMRNEKPQSRDKKIIPLEAYGLKFISFGLFIEESDPVIWRGPMLGGVLNQFLFDVEWGELDYLIIDLPPGTGDMQLSMVQATEVDGVVVISTPQDVALLDSKKGLKMFEAVQVPVLGMIENMSYFAPDDMPEKKYYIFGEGGVKKSAKELGVEFLGEIPLEIALREGSDKGVPYMTRGEFEGRPVWNAYTQIAAHLDSEEVPGDEQSQKTGGFFKRMFKGE